MINKIITTSAEPRFKKANGVTLMSHLEIDQCLAELCYLKRSIDTLIQYKEPERAISLIEREILTKEQNISDVIITKYYIKALLKYDEF